LDDVTHAERRLDLQMQPALLRAGQDERALALMGFHQPRRLKLGDRLAYHRATDAVLAHDLAFGRQLFAGCDRTHQNALAEVGDQIGRQVVLAALGNRSFRGLHD
nr:hypothetical protein [Tanacetum cinerariifolium]